MSREDISRYTVVLISFLDIKLDKVFILLKDEQRWTACGHRGTYRDEEDYMSIRDLERLAIKVKQEGDRGRDERWEGLHAINQDGSSSRELFFCSITPQMPVSPIS